MTPSTPSQELAVLQTSSLATAIEREVERLILSGSFAPGSRINENQLALKLGTSRGPIREAVRALEGSGLVVSIPNRGSFIRRLHIPEALEIYEVRSVLFGLAGRLLAERVTDKEIDKLKGFVADMEKASRAQDFEAYYPLNLAFHEFIVDAAGNATLAQHYRSLVKKLYLFRARSLVQGGGLSVSNKEHQEMLAAIIARDPDRAYEAHFKHVSLAKDRLVALIESEAKQSP